MRPTNSTAWFADLLANHPSPCVSIYFPASRAKPPADANAVHFRSLVHRAVGMLDDKYDKRKHRAVLERLESLPLHETFGPGPHDGLAVFVAPDFHRVINLPRPVEDLVVVSDSFHVKPLIRAAQFDGRFAVLCFSPRHVRVFEGDQYGIREVAVKFLPRDIEQASRHERGPLMADAAPPAAGVMSVERFMRLVDQRIWEHYARDSHLPMLLFADPQHLADFIALSHNEYLLEEGVPINPDHLSTQRVHQEACKRIEPRYREAIARLGEQFRTAKAHRRGSDELPQVAEAAAAGRVGTLLVDADHRIPGVLHRATGFIEQGGKFDHRAEDLLDDLAEVVMERSGEVYVLPHEQMPTQAPVAAVFRY